MRVCSLSSVKNRIVLGQPLAFSVRDTDRTLLLARGQVIADQAQLDALMRRGALVDANELAESARQAAPAPTRSAAYLRERLPEEWDRGQQEVRNALSASPERMAGALDGATALMLTLIDSSPEVALSQVVRQPESTSGHYGVTHSLHAATACHAAARYLGWGPDDQRRAFQAALTMNLGMLQHHETPDGRGYPHGVSDVGELAEMLRYADVYTARLSSRANRPAMSAAQAGRELHQMAAQSPLAAALIKSFGIFPPGSLVRLASGEVGLVVRNGDKAHRPMVSALTNANGEPRHTPVLRDSSRDDHAVVALLPAHGSPIRLSDERIAALIASA